jgi:hypothetical protein
VARALRSSCSPRLSNGLRQGRNGAGRKRVAARTGVILALFAVAFCVLPAHAQLNALGPAFSKLSGGFIWGSVGYRDIRHPVRFYLADPHPAVRGGFAALYGPFGGQPDTTVQLDSVRTTVEWVQHPEHALGSIEGADSIRIDQTQHSRSTAPGRSNWVSVTVGDTIRTVRSMHSHHTIPGRDGWISLAVGYEYSNSYRVNLSGSGGTLTSTFPVGGLYAAAYFGPFSLWHAPNAMFW